MTSILLTVAGLAVALLGISAGIHVVGVTALNPALRGLDAPTYVSVKQSMDRRFPTVMRPLTLAGIAALLALAVLTALDGRPAAAAAAALGLLAAVVGLIGVLRGDLPVNVRMAGWSPDAPPPDWRSWQERWERWFRLRTVATVLAFLAAIAGLVAVH